MNICILDGYTLNPGDLSWTELQQLGPVEIHDRTPPTEIIARASNAEIILTNKAPLTRATLAALPKLKYIGVLATGKNVVDLAAARERGIPVTNVPAYGTRSVAQATFALLLELTLRVGHHAQRVRDGGWSRATDWCFWDSPLVELDGLTLGIVGMGRHWRDGGGNRPGVRIEDHRPQSLGRIRPRRSFASWISKPSSARAISSASTVRSRR